VRGDFLLLEGGRLFLLLLLEGGLGLEQFADSVYEFEGGGVEVRSGDVLA
jgi:hypothetical protein